MVKYSIIFVRGDLQENEAKELNVTFQREHASKVTELTNRIHELEEESFSSKEEASSLTQQVTVLSKERNSIAVEKNHLESHLEDVQKMAFAAKSRVRECLSCLLSSCTSACMNHIFHKMSCSLSVVPLLWSNRP